MFSHFHQNNSFGVFNGPAANLIIEADNAEEANDRRVSEMMQLEDQARNTQE